LGLIAIVVASDLSLDSKKQPKTSLSMPLRKNKALKLEPPNIKNSITLKPTTDRK